jgi:hypothetical protein
MVRDTAGGATDPTPQAVNEANEVCGLQQVSVPLK